MKTQIVLKPSRIIVLFAMRHHIVGTTLISGFVKEISPQSSTRGRTVGLRSLCLPVGAQPTNVLVVQFDPDATRNNPIGKIDGALTQEILDRQRYTRHNLSLIYHPATTSGQGRHFSRACSVLCLHYKNEKQHHQILINSNISLKLRQRIIYETFTISSTRSSSRIWEVTLDCLHHIRKQALYVSSGCSNWTSNHVHSMNFRIR